jgi:S1-C subfamily serine protease
LSFFASLPIGVLASLQQNFMGRADYGALCRKNLEPDGSEFVYWAKVFDLNMEERIMFLKNGCKAALFALLVCLTAVPLKAQTRIFSNVIQGSNTYLGIQMEEVTSENLAQYKLNSERGVIVRSVSKGSPAEAAKLQENDVILEYGGTPVWSRSQMTRLVEETPVGRKVDLTVNRDGIRINLTAQIKERSAEDDNNNKRAMNDLWEPFFRNQFEPNTRNFQFRNGILRPQNADKPKLGLMLQPLTDQLAEHLGVEGKKGALVSSVTPNSPSAGKVEAGDVIVSVDGKKVEDPEDIAQIVRDASGSVNLKIVREKKEISVTVSLPDEGSRDGKGFKL